ncbi:MAG: beta-galactosidase [Acidobacteriaceae bacterium]|nr:beta-galactosidase [Acidobacteriaceae bacterium]MBV9295704.1 beta-galactosidase [Acidobacteriaceae bacterium]MBV9766454.1 beta-galactosidase [Acidobacteriaceae bacterium]
MISPSRLSLLVVAAAGLPFWGAQSSTPFANVLYGAAYYHEYMPYDRLDKDVAMMSDAGLSVVRMGESTWSLWEPREGDFEYAWMDRVVEAMGKAGIKVIMGTPTYSIPTWLYHEHPEVLARPLGGAPVFYGMRQNMDTDNATFRFYAQRLIKNLVEHYRNNPAVIGWQIDNETASYGASNHDVFVGFVNHLKEKFGTVENLNKAWLLNYWGEDVNAWEDMPTRDSTQSTGYKLEWSRWEQMRVTDYLVWQAALVREYRRPDQFVMQDFAGAMHRDVNEFAVAKSLDIAGTNPYHGTQDHMDGEAQAEVGDYIRSLKRANYLVTETNAQSTDWSSAFQYPPYDGQLRLDVYTHLSSGANMVEYWHWHSIHSGQETYWKGILSHDLEPNRAYAEVSRTAHELQKIGPRLVNLQIKNQVAILYSVDSMNALEFMPFTSSGPQWSFAPAMADYSSLIHQFHRVLYDANTGVDFVFPESAHFSDYKVLIVPALYIADDNLLRKISEYVRGGGHVVMTFKSGFCNENSMVRWVRQPGPLREAAGFSYQEFSNLEKPLQLKGDPFKAGDNNKVMYWAEFLMPEHAQAVAYYDHPFFGRWPAITRNSYGSGTLTYEGTWLSDALQRDVVLDVLKSADLVGSDQQLPGPVRVKHGTNANGKRVHYYLNYSSDPQSFTYAYRPGADLLTGNEVANSGQLRLKPWDLAIIEER